MATEFNQEIVLGLIKELESRILRQVLVKGSPFPEASAVEILAAGGDNPGNEVFITFGL